MPTTKYHNNKLIDYLYRGETYNLPASYYAALLTAATFTTHAEQTSGGVSRVAIARSLSAWAGTQGNGTTTVSTGETKTTSNNAVITFAASASAVITASYVGLFDAPSGGNLLEYYPIRDGAGNPITRVWNIGDPVTIDISKLRISLL